MESQKYLAIVIKSIDYKENDKLVSLYTLNRGKLFASLKGVKKPSAKLRYAAEIFCFGEFMVVGQGAGDSAGFVIVGCTQNESFFELTADLDRYYTGCCILEILDAVGLFDEGNKELFLSVLSALKNLAFSDIDNKIILLKFMLSVLNNSGYRKHPDNIPPDIEAALRLVQLQPEDALKNLKISERTLHAALQSTGSYIEELFSRKLKTLRSIC